MVTHISGRQVLGTVFLYPAQTLYTTCSDVFRFGYGKVPIKTQNPIFVIYSSKIFDKSTKYLRYFSPNDCISHSTIPNAQTSPLKL